MDLSLIVAAMILLTPEKHRPEPATPRMETYETMAGDIRAAVADPLEELPFEGPAAVQATEDALVAITRNESQFDPKVRDCRRKGDGGNSISIFQLLRGPSWFGRSEREICNDPVLAGKLAIQVLRWYRFAAWRPDQLFNGYATGKADVQNHASWRQYQFFKQLVTEHKLKISKKPGSTKLYAEVESSEVVSSNNATRPGIISVTP